MKMGHFSLSVVQILQLGFLVSTFLHSLGQLGESGRHLAMQRETFSACTKHAKKSQTSTCIMHSLEPAASFVKIVVRSTNISTCFVRPGAVFSTLPKVELGTLSELVTLI